MIPDRQDVLDAIARKYLSEAQPKAETNGYGRRRSGRAADLSDEEIIELCRRAKNAAKFSNLFDHGDASGYESHSEADQALVNIFVFYTRDEAQVDRLFRRSALMRPKWERHDYRRRTIRHALDTVTETYTRPAEHHHRHDPYRGDDRDDANGGPRTLLVAKLFRDLPKRSGPRPYVVKGLVPARFPTTLYADGGSAKSILALSMAQAVSRGDRSWCGHEIERRRNSLYVDLELDEEEQNRRALQLARAEGHEDSPEGCFYLCGAGRPADEVLRAVLSAVDEYSIEFVVLDSVGVALEGDAGSGKDVIAFFRDLDKLRAESVAVLLVDHQGKIMVGETYQGKTAFGSSYKGHLSRSRIQVEARERGENTLAVTLRQNKANFGPLVEPFRVKLTFSEEMIVLQREELEEEELRQEATLNASDRILLALLEGPAFAEDLVEPTGVTIGTVRNSLSALRKRGLIEDTGEREGRSQQVRITEAGKRHAAEYLSGRRSSSSSQPPREDGDDDKGIPTGDAPPPLTVEQVGAELRRAGSGPAKALAHYLDGPSPKRLEYLVKAVFYALGRGEEPWEPHAAVVEQAAGDPQNHPLSCECPECE
jgi:DNA-binding transcriptional ArsR family regulator